MTTLPLTLAPAGAFRFPEMVPLLWAAVGAELRARVRARKALSCFFMVGLLRRARNGSPVPTSQRMLGGA
jgi:hypothetical protein